MSQTHELKTIGRYFEAVERGEKTFEVRKNDRAFQTGDILKLVKVTDQGKYDCSWPDSPPTIYRRVSYLLQGGQFGIEPQYCVLGLTPVSEESRHD